MKKKEIRVRCWITIDGVKHFGPGPAELLMRIKESGSIAKAADEMGMSYKKAWSIVARLNSNTTKPYVVLQKGGKTGGGAELTPRGEKVVASYTKLNDKMLAVAQKQTDILKWV